MSTSRSGYIDQWRGISVLTVIVSHLALPYNRFGWWFSEPHSHIVRAITWRVGLWAAHASFIGVDIFFVISGYLITKLLLDEEAKRKDISLRAFYIRRTARIWPALIIYVAAAVVLGYARPVQALHAFSFACNTKWLTCEHPVDYLWSLGVEEQFYLVWPALLVVAGRFRVPLAAAIALAGAILGLFPALLVHGFINNPFDVYCLAAGVLCALSPKLRGFLASIRLPLWVPVVLILIVIPFVITRWTSLRPVALIVLPPLIAMTVIAREGKVWEPLRQVGLVSYSLYLWHALPMPAGAGVLSWLAIPAAWVSYHFIERPVIRLGHRWSAHLVLTDHS